LRKRCFCFRRWSGRKRRYSNSSTTARSGFAFRIDEHLAELQRLHHKYRDQPRSLADACIVRMAELYDRHAVFTLESDFSVYRKHGRVPLVLIHPDIA
jgi:hypothetical protein